MASVRISKRGDKYQYQFEIASQGGSRKYINKSGFPTKQEAIDFIHQIMKAQNIKLEDITDESKR